MARLLLYSIGIGALLVAPFSLAHAAEPASASTGVPTCTFSDQLTKLAAIQASEAVTEVNELNLRKQLLTDVIECAQARVNILEDSLDNLQIPLYDLELRGIRSQFVKQLDDVVAAYELRKSDVARLSTIDEAKSSAEELLAWRAAFHEPLSKKVNNFVIWIGNGDLLDRAGERLDYVDKTIAALNLSNNESIKTIFETAKTNFRNAQVAHRMTRRTFTDPYAPDDAPYLLKASLEALARTYQNFFDLNTAVNTALARRL